MHVEFLLLGLIGGGFITGGLVSRHYYNKLQKQLKKQGYQVDTIEQLYNEVQRASLQIDRNYLETIEALVRALEARDMYTKGHSDRVNQYSVAIAERLELSSEERDEIYHGSLLHDIGKIGVYDRVLLKPQGLTAEEFRIMQSHPQFGAEILTNVSALQKIIPIILHHHERQDGSGYPLGLKGEDIPIGARIVQVADTWDAMTSDRPYRRRISFKESLERLKAAAGTQLDPKCVSVFMDWLLENQNRLRVN